MHRLAFAVTSVALLLAPSSRSQAQAPQPTAPPATPAPPAITVVMLRPQKDRADVELHVINVGAGHSVPTGSNRRAIYLMTRVVDRKGKVLATREWMFAPWYGPRPDDRSFLAEDAKRPDRIPASQADEQGPHEAPLRDGSYTVEASLIYDLNRYNDRSFKGDQREISRFTVPLPVKANH